MYIQGKHRKCGIREYNLIEIHFFSGWLSYSGKGGRKRPHLLPLQCNTFGTSKKKD